MNEMHLATLARDVADALSIMPGEAWTLGVQPERGFGVDIRSKAGEVVNFQETKDPRRVYIEGMDPLTSWATGVQLTAAVQRGPAAIARDIARKLLPALREELAACRAHEAELCAAFEARAAAVNAAEALFGMPTDFGKLDPGARGEVTYKTEARLALRGRHGPVTTYRSTEFARVSTSGDGSLMGLELSNVPAEVVMRMLAVLAEHNAAFPAA